MSINGTFLINSKQGYKNNNNDLLHRNGITNYFWLNVIKYITMNKTRIICIAPQSLPYVTL